MDYGLVFLFVFGICLAYGGGKIAFSKDGVEWMYRQGIWKIAWPFDQKSGRRFDRYTSGLGIFIAGVALIVLALWGVWLDIVK